MLSPATLRRPYLNESLSVRDGVRLRILERPSRWMSDAELEKLTADLQRVVRQATPAGSLDYGVASGDRNRLDNAIITLVTTRDGTPVAFNALTLLDCELRGNPVDVLHLGLVMIDPAFRSRGLSGILYGLTAFLLFARRRLRPLWISNVTQVPAVFGMVAESFEDVYPSAKEDARQRYDHLHLARQIMARYRHVFGVGEEATFEEEPSIIRDSYTGGSDNLKKRFPDAPKHRIEAYNTMCEANLDYDRGDDFLQLGKVSLPAARRYFTRSATDVAPTALAMRFSMLALEAFVAPVLQWFASDVAMGDLRPARR